MFRVKGSFEVILEPENMMGSDPTVIWATFKATINGGQEASRAIKGDI